MGANGVHKAVIYAALGIRCAVWSGVRVAVSHFDGDRWKIWK